MKVIANKGLMVPREDRGYIGDQEPVDVPESAYYLRRIADGDLLRVTEKAVKASAKGE